MKIMKGFSAMDNQRIKEYTKDSKTSRSKKVEIVGLLTEQYQSDHDYDELIYWLFKSHYSVVQMFFEKNNFSDEEAADFLSALEASEVLRNKKLNPFSRLWVICSVFMKTGITDSVVSKLAFIIVDYGHSRKSPETKYPASLIDEFKNRIINQNLFSNLQKLPDYSEREYCKKTLSEFITYIALISKTNSDEEANADQQSDIKQQQSKKKNAIPQAKESEKEIQQKFDINQFGQKLTEQLDRLIVVNDAMALVKLSLSEKEREIEQLRSELKSARDKIFSLEMEKTDLEKRFSASESKIAELDDRLRQVYETDNAIGEQELLTLKKNVSDALKMEYSDFKESDDTVTEDNFMANYASLDRIFRILIRFGFDLEG